jgi:hypothetical protein
MARVKESLAVIEQKIPRFHIIERLSLNISNDVEGKGHWQIKLSDGFLVMKNMGDVDNQ